MTELFTFTHLKRGEDYRTNRKLLLTNLYGNESISRQVSNYGINK